MFYTLKGPMWLNEVSMSTIDDGRVTKLRCSERLYKIFDRNEPYGTVMRTRREICTK